MTLLVLAYLGGVLTILSPCILPVLPFVFARAGQSFVRSGVPMLLGMAITFALVATLVAVGGAWAVHANTYGRYVALAIDGNSASEHRGVDVAADGSGTINGQRLYQLLRVNGDVGDHTFEIEFLDPGAEAFAFTFG